MLIYLDQIADKKLKASSTDDANTNIYANSTASIRTAGGMSVEKRLMVGQFYGRVPLGGVIPVISTFTDLNNSGVASNLNILVTPSGEISEDGFMRCDGSIINNTISPFNGRYTPNISDERFIQGSSGSSSLIGGNFNNLKNLSISEIPSHSHPNNLGVNSVISGAGTHSHIIGFGLVGWRAGFSLNNNSVADRESKTWTDRNQTRVNRTLSENNGSQGGHTHTVTSTITGGILSTGGGQSFDVRPKFISAIYVMRVI